MIRYHIHGHFIEERRRGFAVHHEMDKNVDSFPKLRDALDGFLAPYVPKYCYGLSIGIAEEPSLVE